MRANNCSQSRVFLPCPFPLHIFPPRPLVGQKPRFRRFSHNLVLASFHARGHGIMHLRSLLEKLLQFIFESIDDLPELPAPRWSRRQAQVPGLLQSCARPFHVNLHDLDLRCQSSSHHHIGFCMSPTRLKLMEEIVSQQAISFHHRLVL